MLKKEVGFVLKSFIPKKQKYSVLARSLGKIELIGSTAMPYQKICHGTLITFFITPKAQKIYRANQIHIVTIPLTNTHTHICWLHTLLECCYYFLPLDKPCPEIFYWLQQCFWIAHHLDLFDHHLKTIHKICLVRFFELIGIYPEKKDGYSAHFFNELTTISIDSQQSQKVSSLKMQLKSITSAQKWHMEKNIAQCINEHPRAAFFKTITFFDRF